MSSVEVTPAEAPATKEGGMGNLGCSPGFADRFLLTVSYTNNCKCRVMRLNLLARNTA